MLTLITYDEENKPYYLTVNPEPTITWIINQLSIGSKYSLLDYPCYGMDSLPEDMEILIK